MTPPLHFRLRCWVRRCVLASSRGPLLAFYRLLYRAAMYLVVRRLSAFPQVHALYLRRGASKGEITPGISDLDFGIVLNGGQGVAVVKAYKQIARWIPFLEKGVDVYDLHTLPLRAQQPPSRYRFCEARNCWKLLHGKDVLASLPDWPVEELRAGLVREIKVWVSLFIEHLIVHPYRRHDDVFRNSLCVKVLGELTHFEQAWNYGRLSFSRSQAWRWLPRRHPWREPVARAEKENFTNRSWELAEFTWRELLLWIDRFSLGLPFHPYGAARPFGQVELPSQPAYLGFPLGRPLRFLPIDPKNPPHLADLRGQDAYLAWPNAAVSLCRRQSCDEILFTPSQNPELFKGGAGSSQMFRDFFLTRWGDDAERPDGQICAERFWMSCRMAVCYLEQRRGNLVVLDSPQALVSRLAAEGFPLPGELPERGYLFALWDKIRETNPAGLRVTPEKRNSLRALAIVCNFKWSHTDYLVALGRHVNLVVAAAGEVHHGAIANAVRWKVKVADIGRLEAVDCEAWTKRLQELIDQHQPQVLHLMYYHHEHLVPLLRKLVGPDCKLVFECRDPISALKPGVASLAAVEAEALGLADGFVVVSQATRDYYRSRHGLPVEPCLIVPHAFARRTMGVHFAPKLSASDGRLHLALVGTAAAEKDASRYYGAIIEQLTSAGVVVHSHFHQGSGDEFYAELSRRLPNYHAHATVPFREDTILSDLMSSYDLMGVFHELEATGQNETEILSICLPTKAVSGWFHGGIPVVCYPHYRGILQYLQGFAAGFVVEEPSQVGLISRSEIEEATLKVQANREFFTHEHHAARLEQFFHRLLESRQCARP